VREAITFIKEENAGSVKIDTHVLKEEWSHTDFVASMPPAPRRWDPHRPAQTSFAGFPDASSQSSD